MVEILKITGAFGIRGWVRARVFADDLRVYDSIRDSSGRQFSFSIKRFLGGSMVVLSLEGVSDRTQAEQLKGESFFVAHSDLPELNSDTFYIHDLIGRSVTVQDGSESCKISAVYNYGAGDILEISSGEIQFLVPFTRGNFPIVDESSVVISSEAFHQFKNIV